jgi:DNA helicase-2/ATP-dependent DNA helicase PcrA
VAWDDGLEGGAYAFAASDAPRTRCLAGPGTGKTTALMRRVQRLLVNGAQADRVLVVTLTRTAADDLRRSLAADVHGAELIRACTLHSLCFALLSLDGVLQLTGYVPRILANFERDILLKDLRGDFGDIYARRRLVAQYESAWAMLRSDPPGAPAPGLPQQFQDALLACLRWHRCMLVGQLVPIARSYLSQNPYTPELLRYDHVLVDEYQDLNPADQQVIDLLAADSLSEGRGQCAIIGDDDQSIYVLLRNAHPRGIRDFPADQDSELTVCRRCPRRVVLMAQSLIERNPGRVKPALEPRPGNLEGEIHNVVFRTIDDEADGLATFIRHRIESHQAEPGQILVLTNWRKIAYGIRDRLVAAGHVAHSYFSEEAFDTPQAMRAITILTLLGDPEDRAALRAWLALDSTTERRPVYRHLLGHARDHDASVAQVLQALDSGDLRIPHVRSALDRWRELRGVLEEARTHPASASELVEHLLPADSEELAVLRAAAERALELEGDGTPVREFVESVRKQVAMPEVPLVADFVRLMSVHKSKGLTVGTVIIAGLVEGLIPRAPRPRYSPEERTEHAHEQRRVLFVGVTRCSSTLVLSKFQLASINDARRGQFETGNWAGRGIKRVVASTLLDELGHECPGAVRGDRWEYD